MSDERHGLRYMDPRDKNITSGGPCSPTAPSSSDTLVAPTLRIFNPMVWLRGARFLLRYQNHEHLTRLLQVGIAEKSAGEYRCELSPCQTRRRTEKASTYKNHQGDDTFSLSQTTVPRSSPICHLQIPSLNLLLSIHTTLVRWLTLHPPSLVDIHFLGHSPLREQMLWTRRPL